MAFPKDAVRYDALYSEERPVIAVKTTMQMYIIRYRYKQKGDKKPGPVRSFTIYAEDLEQAKRETTRYANYPDIEILDIQPA